MIWCSLPFKCKNDKPPVFVIIIFCFRGGWEKEQEKLIGKNDMNDTVDELNYTRRRKLVPSGIGKKLSLQSGSFPCLLLTIISALLYCKDLI